MSGKELQEYLHSHIPLSAAMQVAVSAITPQEVMLEAPLEPNINHRATVFGGSASTLATLAAWSLLHTRLRDEGLSVRLVIQRNTMEYLLPIDGRFTARAQLQDEGEWSRFLRMFQRKGRARINVDAVLEFDGAIAGRFSGEFVALSL